MKFFSLELSSLINFKIKVITIVQQNTYLK